MVRIGLPNIEDWSFTPFGHDNYIPFEELLPKLVCHDETEGLTRVLVAGTRSFPQMECFLGWRA